MYTSVSEQGTDLCQVGKPCLIGSPKKLLRTLYANIVFMFLDSDLPISPFPPVLSGPMLAPPVAHFGNLPHKANRCYRTGRTDTTRARARLKVTDYTIKLHITQREKLRVVRLYFKDLNALQTVTNPIVLSCQIISICHNIAIP